jgi:hypothetical protein
MKTDTFVYLKMKVLVLLYFKCLHLVQQTYFTLANNIIVTEKLLIYNK